MVWMQGLAMMARDGMGMVLYNSLRPIWVSLEFRKKKKKQN